MSDETKHVTPSAPRTLSEKPLPLDPNSGKWIPAKKAVVLDVVTPEEAQWLVDLIERTPMKYPPELTTIWKKLRRIAALPDKP